MCLWTERVCKIGLRIFHQKYTVYKIHIDNMFAHSHKHIGCIQVKYFGNILMIDQYGYLVANKEEIVNGTRREDSVTLIISSLRVS